MGMEACCILDYPEDREAADIAIKQAMIRQGLDPDTRKDTFLPSGRSYQHGYIFSTNGLTDEEHVARLKELTELGQFE